MLSHGKWGEKFAYQRPAGIKIYRDMAGRFQEAFNYILKCELGHGPAHVYFGVTEVHQKHHFCPNFTRDRLG